MSMTHWWQAPEWGKHTAMSFPDNREGPQVRVGVTVEFKDDRWVSTPIRIYVGASHC